MIPEQSPLPPEADDEISALIATLHQAGRRLEELTAGEVDTVADSEGRTFLLRQAQEQLRQIEVARQAAILNALPAHIALLDCQGLILSVNQSWRSFAGAHAMQPPGEGTGLNYLDTCERAQGDDAFEAHQAADGIRLVLAAGAKSFSLEYRCHCPAERWFLMSVTPLDDDHPNGAVVMHVDITERKLAEQQLRDSRQRLDSIVSSAMDAIVTVDEGQRIVLVNPAAEQMFGYPAAALQGQPLALLIPERLRAEHTAHIAGFGRTGLTSRRMGATSAVNGLRKNGEEFPVEASISKDESTGRRFFTAILRDISERRRAEDALEQSHKLLLAASRQSGMAEVAASVLHNVGNVLNSVNVSASLALDNVRNSRAASMAKVAAMLLENKADLGSYITNDPKGQHIPEFLQQLSLEWLMQQQSLIKELESLRANIDHIKGIVALQQGYAKVLGTAEIVNLDELVEDSLRMEESALLRHGVKIVREFERVPAISAEKHKILQILVNLIRNAKQACDERRDAGKVITLRITQADGRIRVSVSDNGAGIAPENLTRIFSHGFTTRKDGHGFGLHSGALAAAELGGSLTVHSDGPDHGATFTLELPGKAAEPGNG